MTKNAVSKVLDIRMQVELPSSDSTDSIILDIGAFYKEDIHSQSPVRREVLNSIWAQWWTPSLHGVQGAGIPLGNEKACIGDLFRLSDEENNRNITLLEETLTVAEQASVAVA